MPALLKPRPSKSMMRWLQASPVSVWPVNGSMHCWTRVAELEARAVEAEAVAARALRDAEASQSLNKNDITRDQVVAMVHAEWLAQQDGITDAVVENIRDEFPNGIHAQRVDKNRTRQLRSDAQNFVDKAQGGIG